MKTEHCAPVEKWTLVVRRRAVTSPLREARKGGRGVSGARLGEGKRACSRGRPRQRIAERLGCSRRTVYRLLALETPHRAAGVLATEQGRRRAHQRLPQDFLPAVAPFQGSRRPAGLERRLGRRVAWTCHLRRLGAKVVEALAVERAEFRALPDPFRGRPPSRGTRIPRRLSKGAHTTPCHGAMRSGAWPRTSP